MVPACTAKGCQQPGTHAKGSVPACTAVRPPPFSFDELSGAEEEGEEAGAHAKGFVPACSAKGSQHPGTHAIGSVPACTAAMKQRRQSALLDDGNPAEAEEESPREGSCVKGRRKRPLPLPEEKHEAAGATEKQASRMSTETIDKMIRLMKSMAPDAPDKTLESSSDDGELSGESAAESDVEDMFKVEALPRAARGWITEQDIELDRVRQLAGHLRDQPLLPPHPKE